MIEELLTIFQKLNQFFIFTLELFYLFNVSSFLVELFIDDLLLFEKFLLEDAHVLGLSCGLCRLLVARAASGLSAFGHVEICAGLRLVDCLLETVRDVAAVASM